MTNTKERWIEVGMVLGTVPDGVPSEKTEKIFEVFGNVIFFDF